MQGGRNKSNRPIRRRKNSALSLRNSHFLRSSSKIIWSRRKKNKMRNLKRYCKVWSRDPNPKNASKSALPNE